MTIDFDFDLWKTRVIKNLKTKDSTVEGEGTLRVHGFKCA